jgi:hypothetical protein
MLSVVYIGLTNRVLRRVCADHVVATEGSAKGRLLPHFSQSHILFPLLYFPRFPLIHIAVLSTPVLLVIST